jgi:hypothetical protein
MTPEEVSNIAAELKRLGGELNLSESQKDQLKGFLTEKYEQLQNIESKIQISQKKTSLNMLPKIAKLAGRNSRNS